MLSFAYLLVSVILMCGLRTVKQRKLFVPVALRAEQHAPATSSFHPDLQETVSTITTLYRVHQRKQQTGRAFDAPVLQVPQHENNQKQQTESYLAGGLHSLPDAEKADDPDKQQAQSQVPFNGADVVYAAADSQHVVSATRQESCVKRVLIGAATALPGIW